VITLRKLIFPALGVLAVAIVACGGGGGAGSPAIPKAAPTAAAREQVAIKIVVASAGANAPARIKRRMAEAASTNGLQIVVQPSPAGTSVPITQTFDVSSAGCPTNSDGSRTCNETMALAPGAYTMTITSYDAAPVSGSIPGGAHELGYLFLTPTIVVGTANAIPLSLDGVATAVSVTLPVPIVHTTVALTQQAAVVALDAANDAIVANSYVDINGAPLTINLASSNTSLFTVTPASMPSPLPGGATVAYNPSGITPADMTGGATATISATLSTGPSGSATASVPAAQTSFTIASTGQGLAVGSDGQIYVPMPAANAIAVINPVTNTVGSSVAVASSASPNPAPYDVVNGPDGNLWFTGNTVNLGTVSVSGSGLNYYFMPGSGFGIGIASDGTNIWAVNASSNSIIESTTAGAVTAYTAGLSAGSTVEAITKGGDGRMWFSEFATDKIGAITSTGTITEYSAGLTAAAEPYRLCLGPDGNVWFVEATGNKIASITPTGTITEYPVPGGLSPNAIVTGADGNLWFVANTTIGRFVISTSTFSMFPLTAIAHIAEMTSGPDGRLWLTDSGGAEVYAFTP